MTPCPSLYQFDPDDVDLDLGLPVSDKEEFRYVNNRIDPVF